MPPGRLPRPRVLNRPRLRRLRPHGFGYAGQSGRRRSCNGPRPCDPRFAAARQIEAPYRRTPGKLSYPTAAEYLGDAPADRADAEPAGPDDGRSDGPRVPRRREVSEPHRPAGPKTGETEAVTKGVSLLLREMARVRAGDARCAIRHVIPDSCIRREVTPYWSGDCCSGGSCSAGSSFRRLSALFLRGLFAAGLFPLRLCAMPIARRVTWPGPSCPNERNWRCRRDCTYRNPAGREMVARAVHPVLAGRKDLE